MKSYLPIVLLASLALNTTGVLAAEHGGPWSGGRHGGISDFRDPTRMVERMARHLDLDEVQEQNINNILTAAKPEMDVLRERGRAARQAMRALDPADPDYSAELSNLATEIGEVTTDATLLFGRVRLEVSQELTAEQAAELKELMSERRGRFMRHRRHGRNAGEDANEN